MSTLTGNKISLTYKSLIKTSDNDVLTAALKQMSDGLGNNSGVYLNTGGDLKSTGTLEFANFKGTSTSVTINKLVNQAGGISNNDNDTSLPTSAAVKDYVDTHVTSQDLDFKGDSGTSAVDLDSQVFAIVGTSNEIETSASGQQLQIGLPDDVTISGTYTGATFSGDLSGTINTATTATTQTAGNNSTKVATTAYVDTLDAASDLDFSGTTGTGDVNLNTESLAVTGTANQITTAASNQGLEISLLSTGVTMPDGSVATTQTSGDNSTKLATTAYVDTLDAASDLDITDGTNTSDINLNTESLSILGTANEIVSTVSAQTATISLPSTIVVNVTGNVTGDLTGNADTATKWETARDLSLTSEATGTISSVDGSGNVSGAVTLLNSAVVAKVLTGLPTPAAGNIEPSDTILEAFGKVQSQINSISSGLIFKGSWDAATNTPTLTSGGGEVDSGTTDGATTAFKLIDSSQNFNTTVSVGNKVINQVDGQTALVTVIDSNTQLTLDADIMLTAEAYTIDASPFISQGQYYVVNFAGTTNLNGINNWSIGDWVIADADNKWSKLDHSQIDGQGTTGNLPVFATATTIGDSIVAQSGTALTVTGSLNTTLGLSSTGNFAVNTNKFTANATTGNVAFPGDLAINTNKFTVNATSGTGTFAGNVTINGLVIGTDQTFAGEYRTFAFGTNANGYNRIFATKDQTDGIYLASATGHGLKVRVNGNSTNVLTIDTSGNSTFGGDVTLGNILLTPATIPGANTPSINLHSTNNEIYIQSGSAHIFNFIRYDNRNSMMNIESTGISVQGGGTFTGNLVLHNTSNAPFIDFVESGATSDSKARITMDQVDTNNGTLIFSTENAGTLTTALTINQTQNSTFAGNVDVNINASGNNVIQTLNNTDFTAGNRSALKIRQQVNASGSISAFLGSTQDGSIFLSNDSITADHLKIDTSGNATFAGNVSLADNKELNVGSATFAGDVNVGGSVSSPASVGTIIGVVGRNGVGGGTAGIVLKDYDNDAWDIWNSGGQLNFRYNNNQDIGFTINSAGATTFAGNVGVAGKTPTFGLNLAQGTSAGSKIAWTDGTPNFAASIYANSSTDKLTFATKNASNVETIALTIDTSQNSTFAGTLQIGSDTTATSELLQVQAFSHNQAFSGKSSASKYLWFLRNENGSGRLQLYNSSSTHTIEMTGADGNIFVGGGVFLGGTGTANKLDDYEEGTFTPVLKFGGGTTGITYSTQAGVYTKVGRQVNFSIEIRLSNKGSATGTCTIDDLPFTSASITGNYGSCIISYATSFTVETGTHFTIDPGTTNIKPRFMNGRFSNNYGSGQFDNSTVLLLTGSYQSA